MLEENLSLLTYFAWLPSYLQRNDTFTIRSGNSLLSIELVLRFARYEEISGLPKTLIGLANSALLKLGPPNLGCDTHSTSMGVVKAIWMRIWP